ncbi:MAG: M12 family metallo-peptidase [Planctomycetota bacterium]
MTIEGIIRNSCVAASLVALTTHAASATEPLDTGVLLGSIERGAPDVELALPDGRAVRLRAERVSENGRLDRLRAGDAPRAATRSFSGAIDAGGRFVLAEAGDDAYGALWTPDGSFEVRGLGRRDADGRMLVEVVAVPGDLPACVAGVAEDIADDADAELPAGAESESLGTDDRTRGNESTVRVLFAVDPSFVARVSGGQNGLDAYCAALIASANDAYGNSFATGVQLELAGVEIIDLPRQYSSSEMLRYLTGVGDGVADEAHAFRDAYSADLIAGLTDLSSFCGVAWLVPENPERGVSLSDYDCALGNLTFAHELGHNFGCAHDPDNANSSYAAYGFGHRWNGSSRRSVMAYSPGIRVPYFSNPSVTESGGATGIAGQRDNTRLLRETMPLLSSHRTGDGDPTDCDESRVPDAVEIASGLLLDENGNGVPDVCDIENGAEDCNGNGRLDAYEIEPSIVIDSGLIELESGSAGVTVSLPVPPEASSAQVALEIVAYGDLSSSAETISLAISNGVTETFFSGGASDCNAAWNTQSRSYTADLFNALAADGLDLRLRISGSVNPDLCTIPATARVRFRYRTSDASADPLGEAPLSGCLLGCIADLTQDIGTPGVPDGQVTVVDLTYFVEAWLNQDAEIADLSQDIGTPGVPDGQVTVVDLTYFIEVWIEGCQ